MVHLSVLIRLKDTSITVHGHVSNLVTSMLFGLLNVISSTGIYHLDKCMLLRVWHRETSPSNIEQGVLSTRKIRQQDVQDFQKQANIGQLAHKFMGFRVN